MIPALQRWRQRQEAASQPARSLSTKQYRVRPLHLDDLSDCGVSYVTRAKLYRDPAGPNLRV